MHNIYLFQKFVLDHTVMLATNSKYLWSIYNQLGKGLQKVIPSCTIRIIGNFFPSENMEHILFIKSNEGKDRACQ